MMPHLVDKLPKILKKKFKNVCLVDGIKDLFLQNREVSIDVCS